MSLLLSQRDRNQLTEQKENLQEENEGLENANEQLEVDAAKLHLLDIASKKQTDPIHNEISLFEEELRRLIGQSVPQPLQELGFLIKSSSSNVRMFINDGRLRIEESSVEVLNIPIIKLQGFSKSTSVGTDFDILSPDDGKKSD